MGQAQSNNVTGGANYPPGAVPGGSASAGTGAGAATTTGSTGGSGSTGGVPRASRPAARSDASSEEIKRDIDSTRSQMDETIDALSERLRPKNLLNQVVGQFRGDGGGEGGPSVENISPKAVASLVGSIVAAALTKKVTTGAFHYVREHPVSTGMFAAGLAYMMFEGGQRASASRIREHSREPEMYGGSYVDARTGRAYERETYGEERHEGPGVASRAAGAVSGAAHSAADAASSTARTVASSARHAAERVGSAVRGGASAVRGRASDAGHSVRGMAHRAPSPTDMGTNMIEQIRENPVPAALIGAGLAWLLLGDRARNAYHRYRIESHREEPAMYGGSYVDARSGRPYDTEQYGEAYDEYGGEGGAAGGAAASWAQSARGAAERARSGGRSAVGSASEQASRAAESLRQTGHQAGEYFSSASHRANEALHSATSRAGETLRSGYETGAETFRRSVDEYPLAVGGAAFGLGLLLGFLIPETRAEERYLGDTAEGFRRRAQETGRRLAERGRHAAEATFEAVREEASEQGLTPSGLADQARHLADRVTQDVKEEVGTQALKEKVSAVAQRAKETAREEGKSAARDLKGKAKDAANKAGPSC